MISAFWMDRDSGRFLANAVTETGVTHRLEGMALPVLAVPVPARRLMPGAIIGTDDIAITELPLRDREIQGQYRSPCRMHCLISRCPLSRIREHTHITKY